VSVIIFKGVVVGWLEIAYFKPVGLILYRST